MGCAVLSSRMVRPGTRIETHAASPSRYLPASSPKSGTDIAYHATHSHCDVRYCSSLSCYAFAMGCPVLTLPMCCAICGTAIADVIMCGTELGYDATRRAAWMPAGSTLPYLRTELAYRPTRLRRAVRYRDRLGCYEALCEVQY
eukprot:2796822-Rhodomonas_salina.1